MQITIALPKRNEDALIDRAIELGYDGILFLYSTVTKPFATDRLEVFSGVIVAPKSVSELNKQISRVHKLTDMIAVSSKTENIVRAAFENKRADLIFGVASSSGGEHTHYRYGNVSSVMVNLAKRNNVVYGVDFSQLLNAEGIARAKLIGREMQNVRFFSRKNGVIIASFASDLWAMRGATDLQALLQFMGMNGKQAKAATGQNIHNIILKNQKIRSASYVSDGVSLVS